MGIMTSFTDELLKIAAPPAWSEWLMPVGLGVSGAVGGADIGALRDPEHRLRNALIGGSLGGALGVAGGLAGNAAINRVNRGIAGDMQAMREMRWGRTRANRLSGKWPPNVIDMTEKLKPKEAAASGAGKVLPLLKKLAPPTALVGSGALAYHLGSKELDKYRLGRQVYEQMQARQGE